MSEHVYTSANETFLPWNEWVNEFGSIEDKLTHLSEGFSDEKKELYERWLEDQKITSYKHIVSDSVVQEEYWTW